MYTARSTTKRHSLFESAFGEIPGRQPGYNCHGCGMPIICPCCQEAIVAFGHVEIMFVDPRTGLSYRSAVWCSTACLVRAVTADLSSMVKGEYLSSDELKRLTGENEDSGENGAVSDGEA